MCVPYPSSWLPSWYSFAWMWKQPTPPRKDDESESKGSLHFQWDSLNWCQEFCCICSGGHTLPRSQHAAGTLPVEDQSACLLPAWLLLGYPGHRWKIDERDALCVSHKRKALRVQLNLGNFTGHRAEEVKGIFEDFLTCKKMHFFKLSWIFFVKESN